MYDDKEYEIELPERTDSKYKSIERFGDYEFTYCIAYEMAIRTKEFEELVNIRVENHNENTIKKFFSLGIREVEKCSLVFENDKILKKNEPKYKLSVKNWHLYSLDDIINGYGTLLAFYFNKEKVFEKVDNEYISVNSNKFLDAYHGNASYYIPSFKEGIENYIRISKNMPLKILEEDFLLSLRLSDLKLQYIQTEPIYSRPTLRFEEDKIINLPVNIHLSDDELKSYILKIKADYKKDKSIIKDNIEDLLDYELVDSILPKSSKKLPKIRKIKEFIATAFFIYDLYKLLKPKFDDKGKELLTNMRSDLKYEISTITKYSLDSIEIAHAFMVANIDMQGYKDLIIPSYNLRDYKKQLNKRIREYKKKIPDRKRYIVKKRKRLDYKEIEKIKELLKEGKSGRNIAKTLGRALSSVQGHIKKIKANE